MSLFLYFRSFLLCRWARASAPAARAAESWRRFCFVRPQPSGFQVRSESLRFAALKMQVWERRQRRRRRRNFLVQ